MVSRQRGETQRKIGSTRTASDLQTRIPEPTSVHFSATHPSGSTFAVPFVVYCVRDSLQNRDPMAGKPHKWRTGRDLPIIRAERPRQSALGQEELSSGNCYSTCCVALACAPQTCLCTNFLSSCTQPSSIKTIRPLRRLTRRIRNFNFNLYNADGKMPWG